MRGWTYGAEFELSDWDRRLPCRWSLDLRDVTMVNSCGVAVDPTARLFHLGGEVQTDPTSTHSGQAEQMLEFRQQHRVAGVNHRSNLHVHVRVPGLADDLAMLKRAQRFCARWLPTVLPMIEPIPEPTRAQYPDPEAYRGARKRYARRRVSHQKIMPAETVQRQLVARTPTEFFEAEALHPPSGRLLWAIRPRCAVNLRQMLQTDTVEFRHFPGTLSPEDVLSAVAWCSRFAEMMIEDEGDPEQLWRVGFRQRAWPSFRPYDHELELGYQETAAHLVGADAARAAIARRFTSSPDRGRMMA